MSKRLKLSPALYESAILGLGVCRGSRAVDNAEIGRLTGLSDRWITIRTGIRSRYWAGPDDTLVAMGVAAGKRALSAAGMEAAEVDCVLVATISHLSQTPAAATSIANEIGAVNAAALDISAACAGFCYALAIASDMVRSGGSRNVLIIASERITEVGSDDPNTMILWGDGAGAAVVGRSQEPGIGPVTWGSDGSRSDLIKQVAGWDTLRDNRDAPWPGSLTMSGQEVYRWTIEAIVPIARRAVDRSGLTLDDLTAFVPHQANGRIVSSLAKRLRLSDAVTVAYDIEKQGNTSSASVPLALAALLREGNVKQGGFALLMGFGAGMVYAGQVITLPANGADAVGQGEFL